MRELRPIGEPINFDGVNRHFLFTINVIDQIQDHFDMSIYDVMDKLFRNDGEDKKRSYSILRYIVTALVNEDVEIHNDASEDKWKTVTEKYIGRNLALENIGVVSVIVLNAYTHSLPKSDDEDEENIPNLKSGQ